MDTRSRVRTSLTSTPVSDVELYFLSRIYEICSLQFENSNYSCSHYQRYYNNKIGVTNNSTTTRRTDRYNNTNGDCDGDDDNIYTQSSHTVNVYLKKGKNTNATE